MDPQSRSATKGGAPHGARITATWLSRPPRSGSVMVACVSVWILWVGSAEAWKNAIGLAPYLAASRRQVFEEGQAWRVLTTLLVHADLQHLAANSLAVALLAYLTYGYYGAVIHPLLSTILGSAVAALALRTCPPDVRLVGASGVAYVLGGFWLSSFLLIERRITVASRLVRCLGLGLITLGPATIDSGVSYASHLFGFVLGLFLAIIHFALRRDAIRAAEVLAFYDDDEEAQAGAS